tara:strand:- start:764 stop:1231 length:468 start_codon:yes stop_codon:yes gene_type:complete
MANATIYRVLEALQSKTAQNFADGHSGVNLTDAVVIGTVLEPPQVPYACVQFIDFTTEQGLNLASYRMTARYEIYVFNGGATLQERSKNVQNLTSDVIKSVTADRFLGLTNDSGGRLIDNVICNFTTVEGDRYGLDGIAIGYIEAIVTFQSRTGV